MIEQLLTRNVFQRSHQDITLRFLQNTVTSKVNVCTKRDISRSQYSLIGHQSQQEVEGKVLALLQAKSLSRTTKRHSLCEYQTKPSIFHGKLDQLHQ